MKKMNLLQRTAPWWRTKPIALDEQHHLHRVLSAFDLTFLGMGAIIGAGIFVITGTAAAIAGPGVALSFVLAGLACFFSALVYAELTAMIPSSGSAYTYTYMAIGEVMAWIIGWALVLEYGISVAVVAIGWSGYVGRLINSIGLELPTWLHGGQTNVLAGLSVLGVSIILARGVHETRHANNLIVWLKLAVILLFLLLAMPHVDITLWQPFMPNGFSGVTAGAASVFFAYIGFDAVATAAEETRNPGRDLPRGILFSLLVCTAIYIVVSLTLTGVVPYHMLNVPDPVAYGLSYLGMRAGAAIVAAGALFGLTSVMMVMMYGQSRIFFAMSRDGLLPGFFARIHPRFRAPSQATLSTGFIIALIATFFPIDVVHKLVNVGTLSAFVLVSVAVIVLRIRRPELERPFRVPAVPYVPLLAIGLCLWLIIRLGWDTLAVFLAWMATGFLIYALYARHHSALARHASASPQATPADPDRSPTH